MRPAIIMALLAYVLTASCAVGSEEYLQGALDWATQSEIEARWGAPLTEQRGQDGRTIWTYEYRVNRPIPVCRDIPVSDCVRGRPECTAYHLTFDADQILRNWTAHPC